MFSADYKDASFLNFHYIWCIPLGHFISYFFFVLISFYSIGKFVSNKSTLTDRMTCGLLGSFYTCNKETHSDSLVLYDDVNYLYSIRTFALINFFVTGSKSYLSNCPNGIRPIIILRRADKTIKDLHI